MPSKEELLSTIHKNLTADEAFFKRVYGYSVTDSGFLPVVAAKLIEVGRKDAVQGYNAWFKGYLEERDWQLKPIAAWLRKEIDKDYEEKIKKYQRKDGKDQRKQEKIEYQKLSKEEHWSKFGKVLNFK